METQIITHRVLVLAQIFRDSPISHGNPDTNSIYIVK